MDHAYLLSQAFALLAILSGPTGFLRKNDHHVKFHIGAATICMALSFAFLGAWVGFWLCVLGAVRYFLAMRGKSLPMFWLFLLVGSGLAVWRFGDARDLLPMAANYLSCLALFVFTGRRMRLALFAVSWCWVGYNALHLSVFGTVLESIYICTNGYALLRGIGLDKAALPRSVNRNSKSTALRKPTRRNTATSSSR